MTLKLITEKLMRSNKKFVTSEELKTDCKNLSLDYLYAIKYLIRHKYLARIFRGIFYIYSIEERKLGKSETTFYEIIKKALEIKGISSWYFGLETALKFNNLTHEFFTIDYVINNKIFRAKPIKILGRKVKFYKLTPKMLSFGIKREVFNYSDPEKTALDLLHLNHYGVLDFKEITERMSKTKLIRYSKNYDKRIIKIVEDLR